jgi:peptide/nickel transport system substrate-binding protein
MAIRPEPIQSLTRRRFLLLTGMGGVSLLAACAQPSTPAPTAAPKVDAKPTTAPAAPAPAATSAPAVKPAETAVATAAPAQAGKPATTKDTIVVAQSAEPDSGDPLRHTTYPSQNVLHHIYEPLVSYTADGKYQPRLATEWRTLDETTWQFKLRPNVRFTNGEPLDANAVKFSFDRAMNPDSRNRSLANLRSIERVDVVDPQTVNFVTKGPYPILLYYLTENGFSSVIVPPKHVQDQGEEALVNTPIGTGPYKMKAWRKGEAFLLEPNPEYWGGPPTFREVTFKAIPETAARVAELRSGGADLITNVPPEQVEPLNAGDTKSQVVQSNFFMFVAFNAIGDSPVKDAKVRQALNHAVDVDAIVKNVMGGYAERIAISLPKSAFGYPQNLEPVPYDPNRARELLAEAGHPNGFQAPFLSRNGRYLKDKEVVEAVAGYLQRVGVQCELQFVDGGVWGQISDQKGRPALSYPGWSGLDAELVWSPILQTGQFQSYFSNPQLDAVLAEGRGTLDEGKRRDAYERAARIIRDEAPHIPLFQLPLLYAAKKNLEWAPRLDEVIDLRSARFG